MRVLLLAAAVACDHRVDLGGPLDAAPDAAAPDAITDPCAIPLPCPFPSAAERTSICGTVLELDGPRAPSLTLRIADALSDETLTTLAADACARFAAPDIVRPASGLAAVIVNADFPTITLVEARPMSLNAAVTAHAITAAHDAAWAAQTGAPTHAGSTILTFADTPVTDVTINSPNPVYLVDDVALTISPESAAGAEPPGCTWPPLEPDAPPDAFLILRVKPLCP